MMVRYKRYRKRSSRVIKMKFQSFFDISTQNNEMQIISVNAGGPDVLKRLLPFFTAYKYYKLGGVSFKLIPASTLPVDPSGLSLTEGDNLVDPRDQLTPGMCRITNGEDVLEDLTGLSADGQHELYNNMLLDPRWYKWMLQTGVKRFGKPRYWQIGQLHQDKWPGAFLNMPMIGSDDVSVPDTCHEGRSRTIGGAQKVYAAQGSTPYGLFQTGHRGVLGWMPTDGLQPAVLADGSLSDRPLMAAVPTVELFKILTPPAYKTRYYYRAFVTETVYFKDPIVMNINGRAPIDVFHRVELPFMTDPTTGVTITDDAVKVRTGGNDGSS